MAMNKIEENLKTSFGYVKKDLLMLNDAVAELYDKVQRVSMRCENLTSEVESLKMSKKSKSGKSKKAKKHKKFKKSKK